MVSSLVRKVKVNGGVAENRTRVLESQAYVYGAMAFHRWVFQLETFQSIAVSTPNVKVDESFDNF